MRKELMKELTKLVKKNGEWDICSSLTLEECDYLSSKGISVANGTYLWKGFLIETNELRPSIKLTLEQ